MKACLRCLSITSTFIFSFAHAGDVFLAGGYGVASNSGKYDHTGSSVEVGYLFDTNIMLSGSMSFLNSSESGWPYDPEELKGVSASSIKVGKQFDFDKNSVNLSAGVANYEFERRGSNSDSDNGLALGLGYRYNLSDNFGLGVQYNYFGSEEENFSQLMMSVTFF
ncbi:outer membrane beta-barrel protein [Vibrio sp. HN007]|uniref:outer membrane beta-barrel protein n=1 Tax=Vibrio iocasae TaxID=3098914 RepID=UPI0035D4E571